MAASGEEGEVGPGGEAWSRRLLELRRDVAGVEVDLRDADVLPGIEAFGSVRVAERSYRVLVQLPVASRRRRTLQNDASS